MNNQNDFFKKAHKSTLAAAYVPDTESQHQDTEALKCYSNILFNNQEENRTHNSYEEELREMSSIENGDIETLKNCWEEIQPEAYGIMAQELLRSVKNLCIGLITLASRAAIRGGVHPEIAFSMCDSYVQQVESSTRPEIIGQLTHRAELRFTELVNQLKQEREHIPPVSGQNMSPHIGACKNYIFAHLHEKITVTDIAAYLELNPNYLSDLFRKNEGQTILQYILREKISLSRNMLTYSEYSYSEIATYLGFSSQTHLNEHFKRITGMTPGEYRRKYKDKNFSA